MAAEDYKICLGWRSAYLEKVSKKTPGLMLKDRREISEGEIIELIHWWASKKAEERKNDTQQITVGGEPVVEVKLIKSLDEF
jgi:hypothetical protein